MRGHRESDVDDRLRHPIDPEEEDGGVLRVHRVELGVLASNGRAISCYLACGFRQEGVRREAGLLPDGWKDLLLMGLLQTEYPSQAKTGRAGATS